MIVQGRWKEMKRIEEVRVGSSGEDDVESGEGGEVDQMAEEGMKLVTGNMGVFVEKSGPVSGARI